MAKSRKNTVDFTKLAEALAQLVTDHDQLMETVHGNVIRAAGEVATTNAILAKFAGDQTETKAN